MQRVSTSLSSMRSALRGNQSGESGMLIGVVDRGEASCKFMAWRSNGERMGHFRVGEAATASYQENPSRREEEALLYAADTGLLGIVFDCRTPRKVDGCSAAGDYSPLRWSIQDAVEPRIPYMLPKTCFHGKNAGYRFY